MKKTKCMPVAMEERNEAEGGRQAAKTVYKLLELLSNQDTAGENINAIF